MDILAKAITLRIKSGTNFLRIDKGRHLNIKRSDRICQGCNKEIENEEHFLLYCINYKKIRNNWLYPIENWTKNEKLKLLMGYNVEDIKKKKSLTDKCKQKLIKMARTYIKMITAERDRVQKKKDWKRLKYR